MRSRPLGLSEDNLAEVLRDGWDIEGPLSFLPLGAGSYHWTVGRDWFVTVDRDGSFELLERSLDTAASLAGLGFVVAPVRSADGRVLRPVGTGFAVSVFPLVEGSAGPFGPHPAPDRASVLDLIVALHSAAGDPPRAELGPPVELVEVLAARTVPWTAGPYGERARELLREHRRRIDGWLAELGRLAEALRARGDGWVVTHGEPHPGNVLRTADGSLRLIDWDTVRTAPPERDLWMLTPGLFEPGPGDDDLLAEYGERTGRPVSGGGLAFYRLLWQLADIGAYAAALRRPHEADADADDAVSMLAALLR